MAVTVKVSTAQFEAAARQFDASREKCVNLVNQIVGSCDRLRGSWKGEAANNYYNKLQQLRDEINDIKRIIDEHAKDLRAMKKVFEQAEDTAGVQAASLNTDVLHY